MKARMPIALAVALLVVLALPATANSATVTSSKGTLYYIADQGEGNDLRVARDKFLNQPVYTFTDRDAVPLRVGAGLCEIVNGVGTCTAAGITNIVVNVRDRDDRVKIATAGPIGPVLTRNLIIGGRGIDVLIGGHGIDKLKGNNGRDSLRGRKGADFYKGGRGSDVLQTLDGQRDASIRCGDGRRDLVRIDPKIDPRPRGCELGNHKKRKKPGKRR